MQEHLNFLPFVCLYEEQHNDIFIVRIFCWILGDLIGSVQKFAGITGWKSEIEQLIIQNEGSLLIVGLLKKNWKKLPLL